MIEIADGGLTDVLGAGCWKVLSTTCDIRAASAGILVHEVALFVSNVATAAR